ncbi:protein of unknown function [Paraoerskovia marina]|uniref:DUF4282 domain-containing protein n=1 Tax=Paraoerskovia marina TaxID=545619 RepID=A0A1H1RUB9_9CELL|nr:DUF4282 domain-containing protein [Paraoerskovia marina]SDS39337.1 protein of unknown function [Paraoerskovia marina]
MTENPEDPNAQQRPDGVPPTPPPQPGGQTPQNPPPQGPPPQNPPPQGPPPGYGPPPGQPSGQQGFSASGLASDLSGDAKGLFGSLFDLSFTHYITPKIVRIVYVIGMVVLALGWLVAIIVGFTDSIGAGLFVLLFGWIFVLLYLVMFRILLEFYTAVVSTAETIQKYAHRDGVR